jgi:hypothetical protein
VKHEKENVKNTEVKKEAIVKPTPTEHAIIHPISKHGGKSNRYTKKRKHIKQYVPNRQNMKENGFL